MNANASSYAEPVRGEKEGPIARAIERQTSKLPSDLFLWGAGAAIAGSALLQAMNVRRRGPFGMRFAQLSLFVGQWAPTLLLLGVYNKIVKTMGSEGVARRSSVASG